MNTIDTTTTPSIPPTIEFEVDKFYGRTMDRYKQQGFDQAFVYFKGITQTALRDQDAIQMLIDRLPPEFAGKIEEDAKAAELRLQWIKTPVEVTATKQERIVAKTLIDADLVVNSIVELVDEDTCVCTHPDPSRCRTQVNKYPYWYIITEVLPDNRFKGYSTDSGIETLVEFSLAQVHGVFEDYDPEDDDAAADATENQKFEVVFRTATNHRRKIKSTVWRTATAEIFCRTPAQALALAKELDASDYEFEKEDEEVYDDDEWDFETNLQDIEILLNDEVVDSVDGLDTII